MIEQGTDLEANATWSTNVKTQKLVIDISSWSSNTFKNGLPYYGTMKMRMEGGQSSSVNGTLVEICIQISNYNRPKRSAIDRQRLTEAVRPPSASDRILIGQSARYNRQRNPPFDRDNWRNGKGQHQQVCSQYASDSKGFVHFQFIPTDPDVIQYQVKVLYIGI